MRTTRIVTAALLAGGLVVPLSWGVAQADPKGGVFTLTCGATTYQVTGPNGNGPFTPAMDLNSNRVFIPHWFGEFTGVTRDATGAVVNTETEPAQTQGSGKQKNDLSCVFSFVFTSDGSDPNGPPAGYTFTGSGSVTGQVSH